MRGPTLLLALALAAAPAPLPAQDPPRHGLWIGLAFGGGQVEHWSDQRASAHKTTVTASLQGGVVITPALRLGLEANGWGLRSTDVNDPAVGETVNELLFIARVYPWRAAGAFLKGGVGWGEYHNADPRSWDSRAFGAFVVGAGYELRVARSLFVTVAADVARGPLGSVDNLVVTDTGRRFRAWSLNLGIQYH